MLAALGLLLATAASAAPTVPPRPRLEIRIQVGRDVPLEARDLVAIAAELRRIWLPVIDLTVVPPTAAPRLGAVDSLALVITSQTLDASENTGLGWIAFTGDEPQPRITVSYTAAQRMLAAGAWRGTAFSALPPIASRQFTQRALGRAAAHEVGHYLLRSRSHARRGLMRARLGIDDIMDTRKSVNWIDPADIARLQAGALLARQHAADLPLDN